MSREQNRRATTWSMEIVQACRHQRRAVCLFPHSGPILFFRPRYCISNVWKCIFHAREWSFWCILVIWTVIIEFIIMKYFWIYHDFRARMSQPCKWGTQFRRWSVWSVYAWIKTFQFILANLAMASSCASGGKTSDRRAVGIECHGCQRVYTSWWRYDQHRRIAYLRVLCWARYQQNEAVCKAAPEHVHLCSRWQHCSSTPNTV